ncbi:MAG: AMP-binding protein [Lachnospiraceae bacterium]|nr:AMP-binding protein [Lachnospiraceae bacterium]
MIYKTLTQLMQFREQNMGNDPFVTEIKTNKVLTYKELNNCVKLLSEKLTAKGVKKNDRVAIIMENSIDFMVSFYAIIMKEAIPVPINQALKADEMRYILNDSQIGIILTHESFMENISNELTASRDNLTESIVVINTVIHQGCVEKAVEDTALILYTSGSTGNSKGVMLTHSNLLAEMDNIITAHRLTRDDRVLCVLPWFHINGLVITMLTPLLAAQEMVIAEKFSVSMFWKWIEKYKITWFSGVPTIYSYLLTADNKADSDISSLRFARSASSSLPVSVLNTFENTYHVPIVESYGITEGGSQLTSNPLPPQVTKPGSVGLPYGLELIIADDNNNELAQGETGEVYVKGPSITCGYFRKQKETEEAFWNGWFKTGDLGWKDEEGYVFLSGRKKELINRAGEKFSPREIDEVLYRIEGVELACAVGIPNEIYGEEVVAFIKKQQDAVLTEEMVMEYCKGKMADFKVPKEIYFVNEFPQGGNGKIQRLKFVSQYDNIKKRKGLN